MKDHLEVEVQQVKQTTVVTLGGVINEDNNLPEVAERIGTNVAIINTAQVDRINSPGVRDWVHWIAQLERRGITTFFVECSPSIMSQVNLVINFIGKGKILSFYAPFFCTVCNANRLVLVNLEDLVGSSESVRVPTRRCDECDHLLQFDERESFFFSFLSWAKVGPIQPALAKTLSELTNSIVGGYCPKGSSLEPITADRTPSFDSSEATTQDLPMLAGELAGRQQDVRTRPGAEQQSRPRPPTAEVPRTGPGDAATDEQPRSRVSAMAWVIVAILVIAVGILVYLVSRMS